MKDVIFVLLLLAVLFGASSAQQNQNGCRWSTTSNSQLNQLAEYTFVLNRNPTTGPVAAIPNLPAGSIVQVSFPSTSWAAQTGLTCQLQSPTFAFSSTPCSMESGQSVRLTSVITQLYDQTSYSQSTNNGLIFVFKVQNVKNPGQTGMTDKIAINILTSGGSVLEICSSSYQTTTQTITAGSLSCTGSAINGVVGQTANVLITATVSNSVPVNGYFMVLYSTNWANDVSNTPILSVSNSGTCSAASVVGGVSTALTSITCTQQTSTSYKGSLLPSSITQQIQITFGRVGVPSSTTPSGYFQVQTYDSSNKIIDQCDNIMISNWTPNTITVQQFTLGNGVVNVQGQGRICFQTSTQLQSSDLLDITFPNTISLVYLNSITDEFFVLSTLAFVYNTGQYSQSGQTITLTVSSPIPSSSQICLRFTNLQNPPSTQPTNSFSITTRRLSNPIDQVTTGATYTATTGSLTLVTVVPDNLKIYAQSTYQIQFTMTNAIAMDGYVTILFPSALQLSSLSCSILSGAPFRATPTTCTAQGQQVTLQGIATASIPATSVMTIRISTVKNQDKSTAGQPFVITTYFSQASSPFAVDTSGSALVTTYINDALDVSKILVTPSSLVTGRVSTYTFAFTTTNPTQGNGNVLIVLPSDVTISDAIALQNVCMVGTFATSCRRLSQNPDLITVSLSQAVAANTPVTISISNVLVNPRNTKQSASFSISTQTFDGYFIDRATSGITVTMTTPSSFSSFLLTSRSDTRNGFRATYTFQIIFTIDHDGGSQLKLELPPGVTIPPTFTCTSTTTALLSATLSCFKESLSVIVIPLTLSGSNLSGKVSAQNPVQILITTLQNPMSLGPVSSISGKTFFTISGQSYAVSASAPGQAITITNLLPNSIINGKVSTSIGQLNVADTYSIQFTQTNAVSGNAYFTVELPSQILIGSSISCSNLLGFPDGTMCTLQDRKIKILPVPTSFTAQFASSLQLKISGLTNPAVEQSSQFSVSSYQDNYLVDEGFIGTFQSSCPLPCKTCSSPKTVCLSCYSDGSFTQNRIYFNQELGNCESACEEGYYQVNPADKQCTPCNNLCSTCSGQASFCLSCPNQQVLLQTGTTSVCRDSCPQGYYPDPLTTKCMTCPTQCTSCTSSNQCQSCQSVYFLQNSQCISKCPEETTVPNASTQRCDICTSNCQTCLTLTNNCLTCKPSFLLYLNQCFANCPDGSYQVASECKTCNSPCSKCQSTGDICLTCIATHFIFNSKCLTDCPDGLYQKDKNCVGCESPCLTCVDSPAQCLSCDQNTDTPFLLNQACQATCPDGYYSSLAAGKCLECESPCVKCNLKTECSSCITGMILFGTQCLADCPMRYYKQGQSCLKCEDGCLNCDDSTCSECTSNYYSLGNKCLLQCPAKYQISSDGKSCVVTCPTGQVLQSDGLTCKLVCQERYKLSGDGQSCEIVCPNGQEPNTQGNACQIRCPSGYQLSVNGSKCQIICPSGYEVSSDGTKCTLLPQHVASTTSNQEVVKENINKNKYIPVPFCICCFVFLLTVIVAKIQVPETFVPGAIVGFCGLLEWGSWLTLSVLVATQWGVNQRSFLALLIGLVINLLLNLVNLFFYRRNIYSDPSFQKWLQLTMVNRFTNVAVLTCSLLLTFKASKSLVSKYFGFKYFITFDPRFFKARLTSLTQMMPFNIISLVSIFLCSIPIMIGAVIVLYDDEEIDQIFVSALDCVIVTALMIVAILWEGHKNERFFLDEDGNFLNLNQLMNRALHPDYEHGIPDSMQNDESRIVANTPNARKRASDANQSILDRSDLKLIPQNSQENENMPSRQNKVHVAQDSQTFKAKGFAHNIGDDESGQQLYDDDEVPLKAGNEDPNLVGSQTKVSTNHPGNNRGSINEQENPQQSEFNNPQSAKDQHFSGEGEQHPNQSQLSHQGHGHQLLSSVGQNQTNGRNSLTQSQVQGNGFTSNQSNAAGQDHRVQTQGNGETMNNNSQLHNSAQSQQLLGKHQNSSKDSPMHDSQKAGQNPSGNHSNYGSQNPNSQGQGQNLQNPSNNAVDGSQNPHGLNQNESGQYAYQNPQLSKNQNQISNSNLSKSKLQQSQLQNSHSQDPNHLVDTNDPQNGNQQFNSNQNASGGNLQGNQNSQQYLSNKSGGQQVNGQQHQSTQVANSIQDGAQGGQLSQNGAPGLNTHASNQHPGTHQSHGQQGPNPQSGNSNGNYESTESNQHAQEQHQNQQNQRGSSTSPNGHASNQQGSNQLGSHNSGHPGEAHGGQGHNPTNPGEGRPDHQGHHSGGHNPSSDHGTNGQAQHSGNDGINTSALGVGAAGLMAGGVAGAAGGAKGNQGGNEQRDNSKGKVSNQASQQSLSKLKGRSSGKLQNRSSVLGNQDDPNNPNHPNHPNNPNHPNHPSNPNDPRHPSNPNDPHHPSNSNDPHHPNNPNDPRHPSNPNDPNHPSNSNHQNNPYNNPGDNGNESGAIHNRSPNGKQNPKGAGNLSGVRSQNSEQTFAAKRQPGSLQEASQFSQMEGEGPSGFGGEQIQVDEGHEDHQQGHVGESHQRNLAESQFVDSQGGQLGYSSFQQGQNKGETANKQEGKSPGKTTAKGKGGKEKDSKVDVSKLKSQQRLKKEFETPKHSKKQISKAGKTSNQQNYQNDVEQLIPLVENLEDIPPQNFNNTRSISPISKVDHSDNTQMEINGLNTKQFDEQSKQTTIQHKDHRNMIDNNDSLRSLSDAQVDYNEVSPSDFNAMNQRFDEDFYAHGKGTKPDAKQNYRTPQNKSVSTSRTPIPQSQQFALVDSKAQKSQKIKNNPQQSQTMRKDTYADEQNNISESQFKKSMYMQNNSSMNNDMIEEISLDDQRYGRKPQQGEKKEIDRQKLKGLEAIYLQRIDNNLGKSQKPVKKKKGGKNTPPKQGIDNFFIDDEVDELAF